MKYKVGDLVQAQVDDVMQEGEVIAVTPAQTERPKDYWNLPPEEIEKCYAHYSVKWNDGAETSHSEGDWNIAPRDDEYQRAFRVATLKAHELIGEKLQEAMSLLSDAEKISEEHGVPFRSNISFLSQSYTPQSMKAKHANVDTDFMRDLTGAYNEYGYEGWEHSAVC